ncbi:MAG: divalent-cation tolerance protein CutA [Desulfocapsa sp.]|nr:divalent-cation tolerance protein CutA [Desulfocapsa sp.]
MTDIILVVTTFEDKEEALQLGRHLLEKRLVGCAQVSGPVTSQYWWQGKVELAQEYRLEMKTTGPLWKKLEKEIQESHSYDVPEIIASAATAVSDDYRKWLYEELQK